jgi:peptidoglycan hydrolase-like protein with peptidoglycan-binding domain
VRALQHALNARPYINLKEDGDFGKDTETAVREFQRRVGLKVDGIYGPKTEAVLWTRIAEASVTLKVPVTPVNPPSVTPNPKVIQPPGKISNVAPAKPDQPSNGPGLVRQLSVGSQVTFAPWLLRPLPPPGTPTGNIWSGVVSFALVYRTAKDGPHVELALNPQLLVNSRVLNTDPRWGLQVNGQVTFADLIAPGRFHLLSPFIQATAAISADPGIGFGGGFSAGNQVSFDLIEDRLQINLNGGVAAVWSGLGTNNSSLAVGAQGAAGLVYQW